MTNRRRASIKDIALLAGVTHPTVSRALRGQGRISDETRLRIQTAAEAVGYTPSLLARGLVTQRSHSVGLVVDSFADPFYSEIAQGIEETLRNKQYSLFLANTGGDPIREREVVRTFHSREVDGIIIVSSRIGAGHSELLQETGIPLILINTHVQGNGVYTICHDDYHGAAQLVSHLLDRNFRHIAFVATHRHGYSQAERLRGWEAALQAAGQTLEVIVYGKEGNIASGYRAVDSVLALAKKQWSAPPDAICCYNDMMAIGVLSALIPTGLHVPGQIAVTGFDDIDVAAYLQPALTTWRQPRYQMGVEAAKQIVELIETEHNDKANPIHALNHAAQPRPQLSIMQGEIVIRQST